WHDAQPLEHAVEVVDDARVIAIDVHLSVARLNLDTHAAVYSVSNREWVWVRVAPARLRRIKRVVVDDAASKDGTGGGEVGAVRAVGQDRHGRRKGDDQNDGFRVTGHGTLLAGNTDRVATTVPVDEVELAMIPA